VTVRLSTLAAMVLGEAAALHALDARAARSITRLFVVTGLIAGGFAIAYPATFGATDALIQRVGNRTRLGSWLTTTILVATLLLPVAVVGVILYAIIVAIF
jgi:hypothetical protein